MPITADLVCFDSDGTLFMSHEVANGAIQRAYVDYCARHGLELPAPSDEEICRLTGLPGLDFFRQLLPAPLKENAAQFRAECVELEAEAVLSRGRLFPGVRELLLRLRADGRKLALVTNGGDQYTNAVAQRVDYASLLDRVYHHGKGGLWSKSEMIREACRELVAEKVVMVGDRKSDLEGARGAGAIFVGARYGYGDPDELEGADHFVDSVEELARFLVA